MRSTEDGTDGVRSAYDTVSDHYAAQLPDTRTEDPLDLAMVDAFAARTKDSGEVLDAGCGAGRRMSRSIIDRCCSVVGVDLSRHGPPAAEPIRAST